MLTLPFTTRFTLLDGVGRSLYLITVGTCVATLALLIAPVAIHRMVFQRGRKSELVRIAHRLALIGLAGLAVTIVTGVYLALEIGLGERAALWISSALLGVYALLWAVVPLWCRR
ncbi:DUF6328 family protein [Pseudonocardia sp. RS010]|uniref:DUF6328 family protein n=1 Tax=Pseudonocardia sp. RS010 TaxID=3385979 RepID=UPI0039A38B6B